MCFIRAIAVTRTEAAGEQCSRRVLGIAGRPDKKRQQGRRNPPAGSLFMGGKRGRLEACWIPWYRHGGFLFCFCIQSAVNSDNIIVTASAA
jgi:hypothetical protein